MRTLRLLASTAAVVGAATALAMPASAQTAVDQAFLQAVRDKGVPIASDAQALDLAHSTCGVLSNGGSAADALSKIASATHWSSDQAANFGSLAVVAYCKDKMPQVNAPQQEQPQATPAKPRMNVPSTTEEPSPTPKPPPHYPYGPRFGPQDSSPFS